MIKMRWDKINGGVILGMEGVLAKQEILVMQAAATVEALEAIRDGMQAAPEESEDVFKALKEKYSAMVDQTRADLTLKREILEKLISKYEDFLSDLTELDTSILEDSNGKEKGAAGGCHCSHDE